MVLNPNWIEPTFLKLDSWSPGAGFIPIIRKLARLRKKEFMHTNKHLTQF